MTEDRKEALRSMVSFDEEMETKHPGWMTGYPLQPVTVNVHPGPTCPRCGGNEVLLGGPVRPFKVQVTAALGWESNCTACHLWFAEDGTITEIGGKRQV